MLGWIGRHGMVTAEQVRRKFFARPGIEGRRAALRRLQILEELRLIRRDRTAFHRAPLVIRITGRGAQVGEVRVAPARLVEGEIRHAVALVHLVEMLVRQHPDWSLTTERELRQERHHEVIARRWDGSRSRCPDAVFTDPEGKTVAIELELTAKRTIDYERIVRAYRAARYDEVRWYVPGPILQRLRAVIAEHQCDDFMHVFSYDNNGIGR